MKPGSFLGCRASRSRVVTLPVRGLPEPAGGVAVHINRAPPEWLESAAVSSGSGVMIPMLWRDHYADSSAPPVFREIELAAEAAHDLAHQAVAVVAGSLSGWNQPGTWWSCIIVVYGFIIEEAAAALESVEHAVFTGALD